MLFLTQNYSWLLYIPPHARTAMQVPTDSNTYLCVISQHWLATSTHSISVMFHPGMLRNLPQASALHSEHNPSPSVAHSILLMLPWFRYSTDSERNLVYAFVPVGASAMAVIPRNLEKEVPEATRKYHISIRMNCFMPSSYITTIHLGTDELGQKLGLFEWVLLNLPLTASDFIDLNH